MTTPHKCPVCEGRGSKLRNNPLNHTSLLPEPCHACKGAGVLWEPEPFTAERVPVSQPAKGFYSPMTLEEYHQSARRQGRLDVIEWLSGPLPMRVCTVSELRENALLHFNLPDPTPQPEDHDG